MSALRAWFRSLLRPKVTHVSVRVYENGKLVENLGSYPPHRLIPLLKCLNELWSVPYKSEYWFEAEAYTSTPAFWSKKKPSTTLRVTCYRESLNSSDLRVKSHIPGRFMKKMLDRRHQIFPDQIGYTPWPEFMEVKFILVE